MLDRLFNRIVKFQNAEVEEIDWKRIWSQLKWMNTFSKGYRGRLAVLTGIRVFFAFFGIAYTQAYRIAVDWIMPQLQSIIGQIEYSAQRMKLQSFSFKVNYIISEILPPWIIWVLVGYVIYKIVTYLYSLYMKFFLLKLSFDLQRGIRRKVYATILESDWMALTQYRAGDLVQRATGDAETISSFATGTVPSLIVDAATFVAAFIVILSMDLRLILMAFVGLPLYIFNIALRSRRTRDFSKRGVELSARISSFLYESMGNIMVIKSFTLVPEFIKRYRQIHEDQYALTIERTKYGIVTGLMTGMIGRVVSGSVFVLQTVWLIDGLVTWGTMTAYGMLVGMVMSPLTSLIGFIMTAIELSASAERVMTIYELPRDRTQVPEAVAEFGERAKLTDGMGVRISDLSFAYVKPKTVLHDVNIEAKPGEIVALVGPSGEGKTTLIRLALGLLTPDTGRACLAAGDDTLDLSVETREFFSYVP
ncbi:MAG: ABC transporter ATP-binding protein/permease, partial [Clostridia bacterium]|nr:ABC transporter ATP-binding protein/permease [Clostridia bacterium]